MSKPSKISHSLLAAYISQTIDSDLLSRIETIKKIDPVYEILFWLIDEAKRPASASNELKLPGNPCFYETPDLLLLHLFSGNAIAATKQFFIKILMSNTRFYQRLMSKLAKITSGTLLTTMPKINREQIRIKTDEELLAQYVF